MDRARRLGRIPVRLGAGEHGDRADGSAARGPFGPGLGAGGLGVLQRRPLAGRPPVDDPGRRHPPAALGPDHAPSALASAVRAHHQPGPCAGHGGAAQARLCDARRPLRLRRLAVRALL
ncbi:hypothetical protein Ddc_23658 [Ditylenchus destructor]|nr:hypothetical protein Ddc_23658 [Ditylenchus destructor]